MRNLLILLVTLVPLLGREHCDIRADLDGDGHRDHVFVDSKGIEGAMVVVDGKSRNRTIIDRHVVTRECYALEIFGKKGIAILPHGMGVRFYEFEGRSNAGWKYQEIYSFYTASWQGGLVQADVDQDGMPDLFCGNYWIRSPAAEGLPWRLFAINAFHETPASATAQLHWDGKRLLWVESRRPKGRVVWFAPPADRTQLWIPDPHEMSERLDCPQLSVLEGRPVISASKRRCR